MTYSLELREVRKVYGDFVAVAGISLTVPPGTVFGLLGPNGAGKTTTLRMVMDIIAPDSGEVLLFGRRRRPEDLDRIGYLPEERGLYRKMTVHEHLVFLGELHGLARREAAVRTGRWLERLELAPRSGNKVEELSKGMQQKIQLAGTLIHEPEVVILDEPFSGLDPINQELFKDLLAEYKALGKTIVFSTHVMEQAEKLCDSICLIAQGHIVLSGDLAEVKRRQGGNAFRLKTVGTPPPTELENLPGVERVIGGEGDYRLLLAPEARGSEVLRRLAASSEVMEFRSEEPDLETIFIKAVRESSAVGETAGER